MPDPSKFDLEFRPVTYWAGMARATANIKGTARRKMITAGQAGEGDVPQELMGSSLDDETRAEVGRWDPSFMGGEYLPDHKPDEVTIARVELDSVTADVIEIRAWPLADGIAYRVVDEYGTPWRCAPTASSQPLNMRELITLIDGVTDGERVGMTDSMRDMQVEADAPAEDVVDVLEFVVVVSDFYPQLQSWYAVEAEEWLQRRLDQRAS